MRGDRALAFAAQWPSVTAAQIDPSSMESLSYGKGGSGRKADEVGLGKKEPALQGRLGSIVYRNDPERMQLEHFTFYVTCSSSFSVMRCYFPFASRPAVHVPPGLNHPCPLLLQMLATETRVSVLQSVRVGGDAHETCMRPCQVLRRLCAHAVRHRVVGAASLSQLSCFPGAPISAYSWVGINVYTVTSVLCRRSFPRSRRSGSSGRSSVAADLLAVL